MTREEQCKKRMQSIASDFESLQQAFIALGDETRQQIIMTLLLSDHNGIRVGEITEKTHLSRPAVSHHLKTLKDAGIVNMRRVGTKNYYYVDANESQWQKMSELTTFIYEITKDITENGSCREKEE
jgi:DNA-binding transcriptional ArsR family regulator